MSMNIPGSSGIKFIGVVPPIAFETLWYPKRLILMFDSLAVDLSNLSGYERHILNKVENEMDWMAGEGLLTPLSGLTASHGRSDLNKKKIIVDNSFLLPKGVSKTMKKYAETIRGNETELLGLREVASKLRELEQVDAVAITGPESSFNVDDKVSRDLVIKITLTEFPVPSDSTDWESILDFKKSEKTKIQFRNLKKWMNKISSQDLKAYEVSDELQELISNYKEGMKLAKMKYQRGAMEVLLSTTAEVAEHIVRLKFSSAVKSAFQISRESVELLEAEREMPGREIAYLISAQKKFPAYEKRT